MLRFLCSSLPPSPAACDSLHVIRRSWSHSRYVIQNKISCHCWPLELHLTFKVQKKNNLDRFFTFSFHTIVRLNCSFPFIFEHLLWFYCISANDFILFFKCFFKECTIWINVILNELNSKCPFQFYSSPPFHLYVHSLCVSYVGQIVRTKKRIVQMKEKNIWTFAPALDHVYVLLLLPLKPINWVKGLTQSSTQSSTQSTQMRRKQAYARRPASRSRSQISDRPFTLAGKT